MKGTQILRRARTWPWPASRLARHRFARAVKRMDRDLRKSERSFLREAQMMPAGGLCIDLGANVGKYTMLLAEMGHRVHAFEPDPSNFALLAERVGNHPGVTLHQAAAAVETGTARLFRNADWRPDAPGRRNQSATLYEGHMRVDDAHAVEVEKVDFIAFLAGLRERVRLLKIDIEGGEVPLLEALFDSPLLYRIDAIYCETHAKQLPELAARTDALRARADRLFGPWVNLKWH